jgi:hypothetical protein
MSHYDPIMREFLLQTYAEARALAAQSEVLTLVDVTGDAVPTRILCYFHHVPHFIQHPNGIVELVTTGDVVVGISFPPDYLRNTDRWLYLKLITFLSPPTFFHPNVHASVLCLGAKLYPAMRLVELLWHTFDIVTYKNFTLDERDALNPQACRYLRQHPEVLTQLRPPPLRTRRFQVTSLSHTEEMPHVDQAV